MFEHDIHARTIANKKEHALSNLIYSFDGIDACTLTREKCQTKADVSLEEITDLSNNWEEAEARMALLMVSTYVRAYEDHLVCSQSILRTNT